MMAGNLTAAFASAELLAQQATDLARDRPSRRLDAVGAEGEAMHCFDPWFIARVVSGSHRRAVSSLKREGFEPWFPAGRLLKPMPQRLLTIKRRKGHSHQITLREDLRMPYGDYVFIRRLFGSFSLMRLFDLAGMSGMCMVGDRPAMIHDYQIEMMRLAEFDGKYDRCEGNVSAKQLMQANVIQTEAAKERWNSGRVSSSVLDESRALIQFVEEFGRITRVVTQAETHRA